VVEVKENRQPRLHESRFVQFVFREAKAAGVQRLIATHAADLTGKMTLDLPLFPQHPIFFAEAGELVALGGRQAGATVRAVGLRLLDPVAQRGLGQIEIAGAARSGASVNCHQGDRTRKRAIPGTKWRR